MVGIGTRFGHTIRFIATLDRRLLTEVDYIRASGRARIQLRFPYDFRAGTPYETHTPYINFVCADPRFTAPGAWITGFLYYHISYPELFLSAGVRFRCTEGSHLSSFEAGHDLQDRSGLPWTLPLTLLLARTRFSSFINQLIKDELLTKEQVNLGRNMLGKRGLHDRGKARVGEAMREGGDDDPHVHAIGDPFYVDFTGVVRVSVTGPHSIFRVPLIPKLASEGSVIAHFERAPPSTVDYEYEGESDAEEGPQSLRLRILAIHTPVAYLPRFAHLPPLRAGGLLPHLRTPPVDDDADRRMDGLMRDGYESYDDTEPRDPPHFWTWTHNERHPGPSAALSCLFYPPQHFPPLPAVRDTLLLQSSGSALGVNSPTPSFTPTTSGETDCGSDTPFDWDPPVPPRPPRSW
ncbi:hypothetical protein B0H11DRAFT_2069433 [Mycena galericulata]|nr:hypothetical protein B0H11DRAFT_2069433 [Mycena galericulata]